MAQSSSLNISSFRLNEDQKKEFKNYLEKKRSSLVPSNKEILESVIKKNKNTIFDYLSNDKISDTILFLREEAYTTLLEKEAIFNGIVFREIGKKFGIRNSKIKHLADVFFEFNATNKGIFFEKLMETFGNYTEIMGPYLYSFCVSNTQANRSRAGATFENIIYYLYNYFSYSFASQSVVKNEIKKVFGKSNNSSSPVDSILPGIEEFRQCPEEVIIGSIKTTLRERWQEVVEEKHRLGVNSIYLLTVDGTMSEKKLQQISEMGIVLVVLKEIKNRECFKRNLDVIDFEEYFLEKIPKVFNFWRKDA
ncbi:type II restriction endonuclease [Bartonella sp. cb54]|uniref:type II restriction endonuclease n=1 Tax=Bartonella sp. cb54 TaxID=3385560 RepID=UPI0039A66CE4